MIDQFDNDALNDPKTLRIIIKDLSNKLKKLDKRLDDDAKTLNDPDTGLRVVIKDIKEDIDTLDDKLNEILKSQSETRKTIKGTTLTATITASVGAIIAFVMKQLGFY